MFTYNYYDSFNDIVNYSVKIPSETDKKIGIHSGVICGYDPKSKYFVVSSSWGNTWGYKGYFYLPLDFVLDPENCKDFWILDRISKTIMDKINDDRQICIRDSESDADVDDIADY